MTTRTRGVPHGMTANAFSSVSLTPPLVLICVDVRAHMHSLVEESRCFAINILAEGQDGVLQHFTNRARGLGEEEFTTIPHHGDATGSPILNDCLAFVDCQVTAIHAAGDHSIFIGEVVALGSADARQPLLYYRASARGLAPVIDSQVPPISPH